MNAVFWTCLAVVVALAAYELFSRMRFTRHGPEELAATNVYWILLIGSTTLSKMRATYELKRPDGTRQVVVSHTINLTHNYRQEVHDA